PESLHTQVEIIKFHDNLRDLRLALKETSEQWLSLIERIESTWKDWQAGEVGEPPRRLSDSLYRNQQELASYMNELSDLARYSNGAQQRVGAPLGPLYGEMSQTLLTSRQRLSDISEILQRLYQEFSAYAEQGKVQLGFRARLQRALFGHEQELQSSDRALSAIQSQLEVVFGNIRLLEQWQENITLNQTRLAYDPERKDREIKELLQQISLKIDGHEQTLQKLQTSQNELQSELDQYQVVKVAHSHSRLLRRDELLERLLPQLLEDRADLGYTGHTVQLVNPYPYDSSESTLRNKMWDTVRPQIDENELYNALQGFPDTTEAPLPNRAGEQGSEAITEILPERNRDPVIPLLTVMPSTSTAVPPNSQNGGNSRSIRPQTLTAKNEGGFQRGGSVVAPQSQNLSGGPDSSRTVVPDSRRAGQVLEQGSVVAPQSQNLSGGPDSSRTVLPENSLLSPSGIREIDDRRIISRPADEANPGNKSTDTINLPYRNRFEEQQSVLAPTDHPNYVGRSDSSTLQLRGPEVSNSGRRMSQSGITREPDSLDTVRLKVNANRGVQARPSIPPSK
ncbi:MAG: hypothetical protein AAF975_07745, partial [Spirochaetota bacterium]